MNYEISIFLIALITSITCSIVGVFLVIRKMSMMTDAISHTILLGIVIAYIFVKDLQSPLLFIGATTMGLVTVYLIELLVKTRKINEDAATGVTFPLLFSIAVILISLDFRDVHLDIDAVILGKLEFSALNKLIIGNFILGPKNLWVMSIILLINLFFIITFYKELKIVSFDSALASILGISPIIIHYVLMSLVSITAVSAFEAVGSILVISMMIGPTMTSLLISKNLCHTIIYSVIFASLNCIMGYSVAFILDVRISSVISIMTLITFLVVFIFAPKGMIKTIINKRIQRNDFNLMTFLTHIHNHQNTQNALNEISIENAQIELNWNKNFFDKFYKKAYKLGLIYVNDDMIILTTKGIEHIDYMNKVYSR